MYGGYVPLNQAERRSALRIGPPRRPSHSVALTCDFLTSPGCTWPIWFATKWARQEKEIRKIIDSTRGMYGDLQAVTGRSLIAIPILEASLDIAAGGELGDDWPRPAPALEASVAIESEDARN